MGERAGSAPPAANETETSMRMILVAGVLMVALFVAIIGAVSADSVKWEPAPAVANAPSASAPQPL